MPVQGLPTADTRIRTLDFLVRPGDLQTCKLVEAGLPADGGLAADEVLVEVESFAFTANNITYAALGEAMAYWRFFPAPDGWGRIPVWGFGRIVRSNHPEVAEGTRIFGYFPMSTHVTFLAAKVRGTGFIDGAAHRQLLPPAYNRYLKVGNDPAPDRQSEDLQALLRPLFMASFFVDDFLAENAFFGASTVLLTSASSKTAFGTAFLLHRNRRSEVEVVGLTSPGNVPFVEGLGCYDTVVAYDCIATLPNDRPVAVVDLAGNAALLTSVHRHYGDALRHSCLVGFAHNDSLALGTWPADLPGARPMPFFVPDRIRQRSQQWGDGGIEARMAGAWSAFLEGAGRWVEVVHLRGPRGVEAAYRAVLAGRARPDVGYMLSLRGQADAGRQLSG